MKQPKRFGTFVQTQTGRRSDARSACEVRRPGEGNIRNHHHALVAAAALVALGACVSATRQRRPGAIEPNRPAHTASATVGEVRDALRQLITRLEAGGPEAPEEAPLHAVLTSPAFVDLSPEERHAALYVAGVLALHLDRAAEARAFFGRATEMNEATAHDWRGAMEAARKLGDYHDAVHCLTVIARAAPQELASFVDVSILALAGEATKLSVSVQQSLLQALFDASWKPQNGMEPGWIWRELATLLLEGGEPERAREVVARISDPHTLLAMRVDHRFAPLVETDPGRFDVDRAQAAATDRAREAAQKAPRSLSVLLHLMHSLRVGGSNREALEMAEEALRRMSADGAAYDDVDTMRVWIMGARARALQNLGRWDEAVAQLREASRVPEYGGANVSHSINLALFYCYLDRPQDALASIADVKEVTPYGRAQLEAVRAAAAIEMGDAVALGRALGYLRDHRVDAPETLISILLMANEVDDAARELVPQLTNPRQRSEALLSLQQFADRPVTARMAQLRERWKALRSHPEVQAAVAKVGRVERFSIGSEGS